MKEGLKVLQPCAPLLHSGSVLAIQVMRVMRIVGGIVVLVEYIY